MSTVVKKTESSSAAKPKLTRFRVTLSSTKMQDVERVCKDLLRQARTNNTKVSGPMRLPVKVLTVTTRRAPSGQGTASFERWTMKVYKRVIDVVADQQTLKKITSVQIPPTVDVVINQ